MMRVPTLLVELGEELLLLGGRREPLEGLDLFGHGLDACS